MEREELLRIWISKGNKTIDALSGLFRDFSQVYHRMVMIPYRKLIAKGVNFIEEHIGELAPEEQERWNLEKSRQHTRWEERLTSITDSIEKEEQFLWEEEDRVEYRIDYGALNPGLRDKEGQVRLKRDILLRDLFELRVKLESYPTLWEKLRNGEAIRSCRKAISEKEQEQKLIGEELHEIRRLWEKSRREYLEGRLNEKSLWKERMLKLSGMKMEKEYLRSNLGEVEARWCLHTIFAQGNIPSFLLDAGGYEDLPGILSKLEDYRKGKEAFSRVNSYLEALRARLESVQSLTKERDIEGSPLNELKEEDLLPLSKLFDESLRFEGRSSFEEHYECLMDFCAPREDDRVRAEVEQLFSRIGAREK